MPLPSSIHAVRQYVYDTFRRLGVDAAAEASESLLIRGGMYCGRRFVQGDFSAVWFAEEGELKIYCPNGEVECPAPEAAPERPQRVAA